MFANFKPINEQAIRKRVVRVAVPKGTVVKIPATKKPAPRHTPDVMPTVRRSASPPSIQKPTTKKVTSRKTPSSKVKQGGVSKKPTKPSLTYRPWDLTPKELAKARQEELLQSKPADPSDHSGKVRQRGLKFLQAVDQYRQFMKRERLEEFQEIPKALRKEWTWRREKVLNLKQELRHDVMSGDLEREKPSAYKLWSFTWDANVLP